MRKFFARIKRSWNNYLERLAATNKQLYGNGRLDCCDLHNNPSKQ